MCRHLAYLGPPVTLASLVLDPPHSLYEQSWTPWDMRGGGSVNADGFGLGWYVDGEPVRYRRNVPIWADESLPGLARSVRSGAVLAAVRNGTVGMPLMETAVAPFHRDQWFFSHNGRISGWPGSVAKLAETLPVTDLLTMGAPVDSALLWTLILRRLDDGVPAAEAVAGVVLDVAAAAPESRLNVLLTDGEQLVATTWTHSLWVRQAAESLTVSSEPWARDDPSWQPVPDHSLLTATKNECAVTPLAAPPMEGRQ
ncbi:glutamine amidotransferase class-II [Kribbella flavida DSM 17836]|uniref:Gamma-glutamyl-hercynylcysteine sulfoxide hydrolase n=1 Tax=Kribbella flavida (strain DSM 17836 / JCM 10339 / NBRC 14399) TaxID=479435 RepID=D2Q4S1_KRIFD|nr:ergothioneine biosynthesis protein EgtC [Kribbella flavida]ADB34176.1 glutamine amidotransferase class-II [Kribbella flavida DSM 17836]